MKRSTVLAAAASLLAVAVVAQTEHDWRFIFSTSKTVYFCDVTSIRKLGSGHVQAWTKGLPAKGIEDTKLTDAEANAGAERIDGYKPLVPSQHKLTQDEIIKLVIMEQIADSSGINPSIRVLFEVDCTEQLFRELSKQQWKDGRFQTTDLPSEWRHTAPETNGEALMQALCSTAPR